MLSDLLKINQGIFQSFADRGHPTKGSAFEGLALEERLRILEKSYVVSCNGFDQPLCCRQCSEGNFEMVGIVKSVEQIFVERVDVLQSRKPVEDGLELFGEGFGGEFDLASVKICDNVLASLSNISSRNFSLLILLILKPARI